MLGLLLFQGKGLLGLGGQAGQRRGHRRVVVALQQGQQLMADAVARAPPVLVGMVLAEPLLQFLQIAQDLGARAGQQGPDQFDPLRQGPAGGNAAQALQAGPAQQAV